jgi:hypothetical protein
MVRDLKTEESLVAKIASVGHEARSLFGFALTWVSKPLLNCPSRPYGLTMAASVREPDSRMPIAMVSPNIQEEIIARARQLSVAFVPKPITDESIGALLSGAALRLRKTA